MARQPKGERMKRSIQKLTILAVSCALLAVGSALSLKEGAVAARIGSAVVVAQNDPNPAVNQPDKFAWEFFIAINRAANNGTNDALWETWAEQEYVYSDPNRTPVWPGTGHQPKVLRPSVQLEVLRQQRLLRRTNQLQLLRSQGRNVNLAQPQLIASNPLAEEVRMNRATFDFIVANQLWYVEGQEAAFNKGARIDFPLDSKEIKARWKEIQLTDKPRYHWQQGNDGKLYGLIALHIMTKDLPNWVWATWEHVDNSKRCAENGCRDSFGVVPPNSKDGQVAPALRALFQAAGMGPEWQYYRLDGVQIDFTDSTGRHTILGNSEIETTFMRSSSCITCHAKATINASGDRLDFFTPDGESNNGAPDPAWFYNLTTKPPTMKYLQLDFVWSLMLAQRKVP
jgi:hypothetical protein